MECPKCGTEMKEDLDTLVEMGSVYYCPKCGKRKYFKGFEEEEDEEPDPNLW